ncbi:site-specific integrase [Mesorhizobium sp. DCY119]|uniref:site-specific integrase n=1 Tax=Mesorhizobium sp. DCY119 TaxID=2108445 RepID=UPI000E75E5AC|nr:site-specific integrase [Mesorhizobium sp. DCY119]RJG39849.1 hypothetical protein D3Y55_31765 [Mesorhizobium sp. DCY119]
MNFETVATNFLKYFRHARNLSDNTLKAYEQDIAELRRYLAVQGLPTDLEKDHDPGTDKTDLTKSRN